MIDQILQDNAQFVASKAYEDYATTKYPNKKLAILTCMDTRLTTLLPAALGLKNGDAKIIKNAGGIISDPFGSAVRSLLVAIYELGVENIMVIAHTDCGACNMKPEEMLHEMEQKGVSRQDIDMIRFCGIDLDKWLTGFGDTERSVRNTVALLRCHPLVPKSVITRGFIMDTVTGKLTEVECD